MPTSCTFSIRMGEPLCQRSVGESVHPPRTKSASQCDDARYLRPWPNGNSQVASNLKACRKSICENDLSKLRLRSALFAALLWSPAPRPKDVVLAEAYALVNDCLLYTSDAADERSSVDLGGRR